MEYDYDMLILANCLSEHEWNAKETESKKCEEVKRKQTTKWWNSSSGGWVAHSPANRNRLFN